MGYEKNGFTLVECLVCLAVISVLATFCSPSITVLQERLRFRSELITLVSSLQQAKMSAIKSNSFVVLQVKEKGYIIFEDNGAGGGVMGDWIQQGKERTLINYDLPAGLDLTTNLTLGRTRFSGRPGMKAGTVFLRSTSGREAHDVVINTVGRIRS
jgi:type IV fimbrial biogenesis protein FimT